MSAARRIVLMACGAVLLCASDCDDTAVVFPVLEGAGPDGITIEVGETYRQVCTWPFDTDPGDPEKRWETDDAGIATITPDPLLPSANCNADIEGVALGTTMVHFVINFGSFDATTSLKVTVIPGGPPPDCVDPTVIEYRFETPPFPFSIAQTTSTGGAASPAPEERATGGAPGGFRFMRHIMPGNSELSVVHIYDAVTYTPAVDGAIDHINYAESRIEFNPPFAGAAVGTGFVIRQGTSNFVKLVGANGAFTDLTWGGGSVTNVTEADFVGLDFSQPMKFGYQRANTNNGGTDIELQHGIDNFTVTICH